MMEWLFGKTKTPQGKDRSKISELFTTSISKNNIVIIKPLAGYLPLTNINQIN